MQNPTTPTKGPKHRHIANAITARIISGELPDGTKLPARDELAAEYGVNPSTIRQALNVLRNSGMVNAKQGAGTFVTYTPEPEPTPEPVPEVISEPDADPEQSPASTKLKYRHVANALTARILSGNFPTGTRLPGETALAAEYDVSVPTVRQALGVLRDHGMVESRHGAGTFVTYTPENAAAPATADDTSTNEPDEKPTTFNIQVTQQDPELQAIEATLVLLQLLPYETRVRALTYVRDRIESDPNVWSPPAPPSAPPLQPASRREVAQALAEADERVWADMTPIGQSSYYRRADALNQSFAVVQAAR